MQELANNGMFENARKVLNALSKLENYSRLLANYSITHLVKVRNYFGLVLLAIAP
ncbi:hypothetical protein I8752_12355 [Nostocaceae cyanobacterium CENA369]|uniref:Uncharacterized protein n=1 Tax=Dendronalium phyllosphericum CENA369 TaxID=1725256 RepID=A0A8J7I4D5_9NOST|nr:hypothetical protein [Dendronalium phyllosphericum]MBH8573798.1 hypothetical protein [Dendronalium phyllosphericum CENA369]